LLRLGNTFGYARVVDLPLTVTCSISAIVSELTTNNIYTKLCENQTHDFTLQLNKCNDDGTPGTEQIKFIVKGARLDTENFSNSIGDNQTVDISFSTNVGGANDQSNGLFIDGNYEAFSSLANFPMGVLKDLDSSYTT